MTSNKFTIDIANARMYGYALCKHNQIDYQSAQYQAFKDDYEDDFMVQVLLSVLDDDTTMHQKLLADFPRAFFENSLQDILDRRNRFAYPYVDVDVGELEIPKHRLNADAAAYGNKICDGAYVYYGELDQSYKRRFSDYGIKLSDWSIEELRRCYFTGMLYYLAVDIIEPGRIEDRLIKERNNTEIVELVCEEIEYAGKLYLLDESSGVVYSMEQEPIGRLVDDKIVFY